MTIVKNISSNIDKYYFNWHSSEKVWYITQDKLNEDQHSFKFKPDINYPKIQVNYTPQIGYSLIHVTFNSHLMYPR